MVVLPDADINMAADASVSAGFGSAGERCMAISVVVAVGDVADPLIEAITARLPALEGGTRALIPLNEMGPLITGEHRDKVASYIAGAASEGATLVVDGREGTLPEKGFLPQSITYRQCSTRHEGLRRRDLRTRFERHPR